MYLYEIQIVCQIVLDQGLCLVWFSLVHFNVSVCVCVCVCAKSIFLMRFKKKNLVVKHGVDTALTEQRQRVLPEKLKRKSQKSVP